MKDAKENLKNCMPVTPGVNTGVKPLQFTAIVAIYNNGQIRAGDIFIAPTNPTSGNTQCLIHGEPQTFPNPPPAGQECPWIFHKSPHTGHFQLSERVAKLFDAQQYDFLGFGIEKTVLPHSKPSYTLQFKSMTLNSSSSAIRAKDPLGKVFDNSRQIADLAHFPAWKVALEDALDEATSES